MKTRLYISSFVLLCLSTFCNAKDYRWDIAGHHAVEWNNLRGGVPHDDHIEMAGEKVAVVYFWGVDADEQFYVSRHLVFPMLRTIPNNTHASWMPHSDINFLEGMKTNNRSFGKEHVKKVSLDGKMIVFSVANGDNNNFELTRVFFPSTKKAAVCESYTFKNVGEKTEKLLIPSIYTVRTTNSSEGTRGSYRLVARSEFSEDKVVTLKPGESTTFYCTIQAYCAKEEKELPLNVPEELAARQAFVDEVTGKLDFQCPDDTLNTLFAMSKIRGSESIYRTRGGLMHGPGGESYYAAIWANDQAEYISPFFPFLGYKTGNESGLNCWRLFKKYINPEYKFIPWSIIAEGDDVYGPFDRGDAAMISYGASRYCLEMGDKAVTEEIWPLIEWCLEYCHRKINEHGVVASDGDELEHRLPSGDANLCTSSLYYDALNSATYLCSMMGKNAEAKVYQKQASELRRNLDSFFHATVEGYDTYRYYDGNDQLRSWICIPLTMGIYDRAAGTIQAMFSPQLWTENGMLSVSTDKIYWDRSTLYGLRGTFAAGYPDKALEFLHKFSAFRLLGEHVPYVIEAWPEGGQRHLSAENGLYCRIITEGLLGFRPTGYTTFDLTPQMPKGWDTYTLKNIYACSPNPFDIIVARKGNGLQVTICRDGKILKKLSTQSGKKISVKM